VLPNKSYTVPWSWKKWVFKCLWAECSSCCQTKPNKALKTKTIPDEMEHSFYSLTIMNFITAKNICKKCLPCIIDQHNIKIERARLSIAAAASSANSNSTKAKPRCFSADRHRQWQWQQ